MLFVQYVLPSFIIRAMLHQPCGTGFRHHRRLMCHARASNTLAHQHVLVIPGIGGSVLHQNNRKVWPPSLHQLLDIDAWKNMLSVVYDSDTNTFTKTYKDVGAYPMGTKNSILQQHHIPIKMKYMQYYGPLLRMLRQREHTTVHEIPYDFRTIMDTTHFSQYIGDLIQYIERHSPATIICHSFGGILTQYLLATQVSQAWKDQHIKRVIYVSVPFGGTMKALRLSKQPMISLPLLSNMDASFLASFAGILACFPHPRIFGEASAHARKAHPMFTHIDDWNSMFVHNGVNTTVIYAMDSNMNRTEQAMAEPYVMGPGDGTVSYESLMVPRNWTSSPSNTMHWCEIMSADHSTVLSSAQFIQTVSLMLEV